jgi:DNA-binding response OmpR family regulator
MVYGMVRQSGGAVWLDSRPGAGTTVHVYLPSAKSAPEIEAPARPSSVTAVDATVLVVEDEGVVRQLVERTLRREGYRVLVASDGVHALEVSRGHVGPIEMLVCDVVMPRMGGRELVGHLLAERPGLRVLFMSGYPKDALDLRELTGAAGDYVQKPFVPRQLLERVNALLSPAALRS